MHRSIQLILAAALLLSCKQKDNKLQQTADTAVVKKESVTAENKPADNKTDTLAKALGNYYSNCTPDTTKQIKLVLGKTANQYTAQLLYTVNRIQLTGTLKRDTINFDRDFNIWSFTKGKTVYAFRFSKSDNNGIDVALINEDYKKEFTSCTDAKEVDFVKR